MRRHTPPTQTAREGIYQLLLELAKTFPDAARAGIQALSTQESPTRVGVALAAQLQVLLGQMRQAGEERCLELQSEIVGLQKNIRQQERQLQEKLLQIEQYQRQLQEEKEKYTRMQRQLSEQARLIAEQHLRLMELLGSPEKGDKE